MTQIPTSQRFTRARIVEIGRTQGGWMFLALAAQALRVAPQDDEVRLLAVRSLAGLGLGGAARIVLDRVISPDLRDERDRLRGTMESAPALDFGRLIEQARANLRLVAGLDVEQAIEGWVAQGATYHRARDGNVVRIPRGADDLTMFEWVGDLVRAAGEFCRVHLRDASREPMGPITLEGMSPPWLLLAMSRATPPLNDGYQPMLQIVQSDPGELAEGFALADVRAVLSRARVFAGPDAAERWEAHVWSRFDCQATGPVVPASTLRRGCKPVLSERMSRLSEEQRREGVRLQGALVARDRARDSAWWNARWNQPARRRVLIPTCRFSTFIQHASEDLAEAFRARGWEARVLVEPDAHSRFSTLAYHRSELEFDPDLIVLINYPRAARSAAFVTQTPFVCWVQDAMPHLFDERMGRGHGPRDFVAGYVYPQLFREFGYPADRALSMPVPVSPRKFHDGPVGTALRERFACEVAYVSHHSETPQKLHERLCGEVGDPAVVRVLDVMRGLIEERYEEGMSGREERAFKCIAGDAWVRARGQSPTPRVMAQLTDQYLVPMLERMLRHEVLEWARQVCERRGWRLRLFGRGWERHPTLAPFAAGEVGHGEELRVCYQAAGVHLHASMTTLVHQRVMECALSGGLPVCRAVSPVFGASRQKALCRLAREVEPDERRRDGGLVYRTSEHADLAGTQARLMALGLHLPDELVVHPHAAESMRRFPIAFDVWTPEDLFGPDVPTLFAGEAGLERLIERALGEPDWKQEQSGQVAQRVRAGLTHDVLVERIESLVRASL